MVAIGVLAVALGTGTAHAASQRTFVSGLGVDTNPCSLAAPCRTFAGALVNTLPGGEIYVLDSAGYGSVTINQAVSIVNQTSTAAATAFSGNAITINAGPTDKVLLRGLTIVGANTASNGIVFISGGSLSVEDCSVSQFTFGGILFEPNSPADLTISRTRVANLVAGGVGIYINPIIPTATGKVTATLVEVEAIDTAQAGVFIDGRQGSSNLTLRVTVANSVLADSATDGVHAVTSAGGAPTFVMVRDTTISNNGFGTSSEGGAILAVAHSTISGNGQAFFTGGGSTTDSYVDNNVDGNGSLGPVPTTIAHH
jgi:hypothetical protein